MSTKITSVEISVIRVPVRIRLSIGVATETYHLLVIIYTDNGTIGVGEGISYGVREKSYTDIVNACLLCRKISKKLKGMQLTTAKEILPQIQVDFINKPFFDYGSFLALETAIIDALSKYNRVPFAKILGAVYRNKVPVCGTVFLDTPQSMAITSEKWISKGVRHLKVKVMGRKDIDCINLKYIREKIGFDPIIRVDVNGAYKNLDHAVVAINELSKYEIAIVEQPLPWNDFRGLKNLRRAVTPKIMVDESLRTPSDVELITSSDVADIINFHPSKLGCLSITKDAILRTLDVGLEYMIGSGVMTGIGVSAHLALAASIAIMNYPNEEIGLFEMFGRDIIQEPLRIHAGCMKMNDYYLDGISLNRASLKLYQVKPHYSKYYLNWCFLSVYSKFPITFQNQTKKIFRKFKSW